MNTYPKWPAFHGWEDWKWMYTVREEAWCVFNLLSCNGLHIQTDTDWQIVGRSSVMFETVLANAYLVNDVKRLHVWAYARMMKYDVMNTAFNYLRIKEIFFVCSSFIINNLVIKLTRKLGKNDYTNGFLEAIVSTAALCLPKLSQEFLYLYWNKLYKATYAVWYLLALESLHPSNCPSQPWPKKI